MRSSERKQTSQTEQNRTNENMATGSNPSNQSKPALSCVDAQVQPLWPQRQPLLTAAFPLTKALLSLARLGRGVIRIDEFPASYFNYSVVRPAGLVAHDALLYPHELNSGSSCGRKPFSEQRAGFSSCVHLMMLFA